MRLPPVLTRTRPYPHTHTHTTAEVADQSWVRTWVDSLLKPNPSGPGFLRQYNPAGARALLDSFYRTDCRPALQAPPPGAAVHVVRALLSDLWMEEDGAVEVGGC